MTDRRKRCRSLAAGYQYGDAGDGARVILLEADEFVVGQLPHGTTIHRKPPHWNVIEGEEHDAPQPPLPPPPRRLDD